MGELSCSTVSINVRGKNLSPDDITQRLGSKPTRSERKGDIIIKPNGQTRVARTGLWQLSYGESDSVQLEIKIEGLLNKLTNDLQVWEQITGEYQADIFCGLFLDGWNEGHEMSPSLMKKLGERNLKIGFDIYAPADSWDVGNTIE